MRTVFLVALIGGSLLHLTGLTQTKQAQKITQVSTPITVANFGPLVNKKKSQTDQLLSDPLFGLERTVTPIDYFFNIRKPSCTNKICFGMVPIPAAYYQSEDQKKEFFVATSLKNTGFMFRYRF